MGRRLRKKELLSEIQRERCALDEALALKSRRQMTKDGDQGVTPRREE